LPFESGYNKIRICERRCFGINGKKIIAALFIVLISLSLAGCTKSDALEALNASDENLTGAGSDNAERKTETQRAAESALPAEMLTDKSGAVQARTARTNDTEGAREILKLKVTINGKKYTASLENTQAAKELTSLLPLTLSMQEMNGNEKYGDLPQSLTQKTYSPGEIHAGDILLWGADTLVIFYKSFPTSYSYTAIGHIDDPSEIDEAVGSGSAEVLLEAG